MRPLCLINISKIDPKMLKILIFIIIIARILGLSGCFQCCHQVLDASLEIADVHQEKRFILPTPTSAFGEYQVPVNAQAILLLIKSLVLKQNKGLKFGYY